MTTPLASLSIAAQVILDMHSLNNEGGEGNQIQTRMVEIVDASKQLYAVNAISGDMLKHILMEHFYQLARAEELTLCEGCKRFNANRVNADREFLKQTESLQDSEFLSHALARCAIDDVAGIFVTENRRAIHRKSVVDFGWTLGHHKQTHTDSYLHVKYVYERSEQRRAQDALDQQRTGSNLGQNIFHRPASSGVYAMVCHLELMRIGYNDVLQTYIIDEEERQKRCAVLLESLLHTFLELNGATRSTQLPHLVSLEGAITTSTGVRPAPLISPLMNSDAAPDAYRTQLRQVIRALNGSNGQSIEMHSFDTVGEFADQMRALIDSRTPFALKVPPQKER
jgi:CRISPR-associated protein Cst2